MTAPFTPEKILNDGEDHTVSTNPYNLESGRVRKGTVAATLNNIALLNRLLASTTVNEAEIKKIVAEIDKLIPSLKVIGMFDLFRPQEWIGEGEQMGRVITAALYFKHYPQEGSSFREKALSILKLNNCNRFI